MPSGIVGGKEKLQYIKRVLANGFDNDKPDQIFLWKHTPGKRFNL